MKKSLLNLAPVVLVLLSLVGFSAGGAPTVVEYCAASTHQCSITEWTGTLSFDSKGDDTGGFYCKASQLQNYYGLSSLTVNDSEYNNEVTANEPDGLKFKGWFTKSGGWSNDDIPHVSQATTLIESNAKIIGATIKNAGTWFGYPIVIAKYVRVYDITAVASPAVGGSVVTSPKEGPFEEGSTVTLTANVTNDSYRLSHWEKDGIKVTGSDGKTSLSITATANATYTVVLALKEYTVTFHDPSGTYEDVAKTVKHGQAAEAPSWNRTGYGLSWSTSFDKITANVMVNAQWTAKGSTVTFNANGGSTPSPATKNVTYDSTYGTLPSPTRTGYTFAGWWTAASGGTEVTADTKVQITAAQTLHAHWTLVVYTITYSGLKPGAANPTTNPTTYTVETPTITFAPPTAVTGFTFSGWSLASIAKGTTGNKTVTASYLTWIDKPTPAQYELSYNGGKQTIASGSNMAASGHQETAPGTYTATFTPNAGYCWSDGTTASYSFEWRIVNADITGVSAQQSGSLTYNGEAQQPAVYQQATVKGGQAKVWKYSTKAGEYSTTMPSFTDAGTYTVFYEVSAQYHNSAYGSFPVTVDRARAAAIVVSPTHLPYTKKEQGPTVSLQHCHEVAGSVKRATAIGTYAVKAEPDANYAWSNGETSAREVEWSIGDSLYAVQFDGNGGAGEMASTNLAYNEEYVVPDCLFTKTGCEFQRWQVLIDSRTVTNYLAGTVVSNLTAAAGKTVTLKADWKGYYTIAFDGNGATNTVMASQLVERDVTTNLSANAYRRTGYGFLGWDDANGKRYADGEEVRNLAEIGETNTLKAAWSTNAYTVVFYGNGGTNTMAAQGFAYDVEQALSSNRFVRSGFTFAGWATDPTNDFAYVDGAPVKNLTTVDGADLPLYAKWTANGREDVSDFSKALDCMDVNFNPAEKDELFSMVSDGTAKGGTCVKICVEKGQVTGKYMLQGTVPCGGRLIFSYKTEIFDTGDDHLTTQFSGIDAASLARTSEWTVQTLTVESAAEVIIGWKLTRQNNDGWDYEDSDNDFVLIDNVRWEPAETNAMTVGVTFRDADGGVFSNATYVAGEAIGALPTLKNGEGVDCAWTYGGRVVGMDWIVPAAAAGVELLPSWGDVPPEHPVPEAKDAVTISSAAVADGAFTLSFKSDARFDYNLITNANLLIDSWGVMATEKGTGETVVFDPPVIDGLPQLFYRVETIRKRD